MDSKAQLASLLESLGPRLRIERKARRLTLDQVAAETDVDRAEWSRIERGLRPLNEDKAEKLAALYGVTADVVKEWAEAAGKSAAVVSA